MEMTKADFQAMERYMCSCMTDNAHDRAHIYRVLYAALDIAMAEQVIVDMDVLIAACLLHDIGREKQFQNPQLCHAQEGGEMAYAFLRARGWGEEKAAHVREAVGSHRYRGDNPPASNEAKILFDADKLDAAGVMGIARTLIYQGKMAHGLYSIDESGDVIPGELEQKNTFFKEYKYKLENVYDKFYTQRAKKVAAEREKPAKIFWEALYGTASQLHERGRQLLEAQSQG